MKQLIVHIEYAPEIETEPGAIVRNIDALMAGIAKQAEANGDLGWRFFPSVDEAMLWEEGGFGDE